MRALIIFISTACFSGYSPWAPGTAGSLVGIPLHLALSRLHPAVHLALLAALVILGMWSSTEAEKIFGQKDSGRIAVDEMVGMAVSLYLIRPDPLLIFLGFIIFRIFDIFKPIPSLERVRGGFGVMLDDLAAGIITNAILRLLVMRII